MTKLWKLIHKKFMPRSIIKAYIIIQRSLVYNDNTYDVQDGGEPMVAFLNRKEAEKKCFELNIKALREFGNLRYLDLYMSSVDKDGKLGEKLAKYRENPSYSNDDILDLDCTNLTDEQLTDILESLEFEFNYIQAVELE